jgi:ATP-binding cassette, subfamily B, bacterial
MAKPTDRIISMNYSLNTQPDISNKNAFRALLPYLKGEWKPFAVAAITTLVSSLADIIAPFLITIIIDTFVTKGDKSGVLWMSGILLLLYIATTISNYIQGSTMGTLAQRILLGVRNDLFAKIQSLPLAFFNQNKTGDIIARINSDTEKINTFLSRTIFQFFSSFVIFIGIGVFVFFLNVPLSLTLWASISVVILVMWPLNPLVKKTNRQALETNGDMTAVIDENFTNYKAVVAFNQQHYLRETFGVANIANYKRTIVSQVLNGIFQPLYGFAGHLAQVAVLIVGVYLVSTGQVTIGLVIGFLTYAQKLSTPLEDVGSSWGSVQSALAAWRRILQFLQTRSK